MPMVDSTPRTIVQAARHAARRRPMAAQRGALLWVALVACLSEPAAGGEDLPALRREAASLRANLQRVERRIAAAEARAPTEPQRSSTACGGEPLLLDSATDAVVRLPGGVKLSRIGFGGALWGNHINATAAFSTAINAGYRWMDTSLSFGNSESLAAALADTKQPIRLVGRIPASSGGASMVDQLAEMREKLGALPPKARLDILLLDGVHPSRSKRLAMWRQVLQMRDRGEINAAGVSNWAPRHLAELEAAHLELPALVQIEFHVFLQSRGVIEWCQERGVAVAAYGTLGGRNRTPRTDAAAIAPNGVANNSDPVDEDDGGYARVRYLHPAMLSVVDNPVLAAIGRRHGGKSAAQVAIRWTLQRGLLVMPSSASEEHQLENLDVFGGFELSDSEMADVNSLDVLELAPLGLYGFGDPNDAIDADPPEVIRKSSPRNQRAAAAGGESVLGTVGVSEEERRAGVMELLGSSDITALDLTELSARLQALGFTYTQVEDLITRLHGPGPSLRENSGLGQAGKVHPFLLANSHANVSWLALAAPLYSPQMGVENMGPLLYSLVRFFKPARVLEVGAGFTSLFILQALADNAAEIRQYQRLSVGQQEDHKRKNASTSACFLPDGTTPWCVEDWLENERQRQRLTPTTLHCIDKLATASRVRQIAQVMGTEQHLRLHVADIFDPGFDLKLDESLGGAGPLDMIWLDFGSGEELPDVTGRLWRRLRAGGLLLVHSTMTNAYGRLWLRSLREGEGLGTMARFGLRGEFELLSLFEPHKRLQNSVTILRKLGDDPPIYSWAA